MAPVYYNGVDVTKSYLGSGTAFIGIPTVPLPPLEVQYLVIAGGGGGGLRSGGGGGAGGYRSSVSGETSGSGSAAETPLTLLTNTNYTVTVGAGGAPGNASSFPSSYNGLSGSNSVFATITSTGGGGGGHALIAGSGGSGAGGGGDFKTAGTGTVNEGRSGGVGNNNGSEASYGGGGGGGASALGGAATLSGNNVTGGNGGAGIASSITGTSVTRAGGGGGGISNTSTSVAGTASGGGGAGSKGTTTATSGTVNTGGGGGGGGFTSGTNATPGTGGSGVVIVKYPYTYSITSGSAFNANHYLSGSYKITEFTSGSGNIQFQPFSLDPDAEAFLNATAITNATIQDAINTLTLDLKDNGLWTSMSAIYPMVGGTADTHKYNLKDPRDANDAYRITFSGSWVHSEASGSIPNGAANGTGNTSGNTHYSGSGTDNNVSLSYYTRTNVMQNNVAGLFTFGTATGANASYAIIINRTNAGATGLNVYSNMGADAQGAGYSYSNVAQRGLVVGSRTSSTSNKVYHNGTLRATTTTTNTGAWPTTRGVHLGNPDIATFSGMNCQFAHIGLGLTDAQVSTLSTIVENFQDALGRGI